MSGRTASAGHRTAAADRLLQGVHRLARARARRGERVWLVVSVAVWLVRRSRRDRTEPLWRGRLAPGSSLVVTVRSDGADAP